MPDSDGRGGEGASTAPQPDHDDGGARAPSTRDDPPVTRMTRSEREAGWAAAMSRAADHFSGVWGLLHWGAVPWGKLILGALLAWALIAIVVLVLGR
jgi:hypothetical protein